MGVGWGELAVEFLPVAMCGRCPQRGPMSNRASGDCTISKANWRCANGPAFYAMLLLGSIISIQLSPDIEAGLQAEADARGMDVDALIANCGPGLFAGNDGTDPHNTSTFPRPVG
jgi:hypothetical protein